MGLDQFSTTASHLGDLNRIHVDLLVNSLNLTLRMYPKLIGKQIQIFVEANLSHDLAAYVERRVKEFYGQSKHTLPVKFVKQYDGKGKLLPGILTRHKANLVSYFKRVLDEERLFLCRKLSTVAKAIDCMYSSGQKSCITELLPTEQETKAVIKVLTDQASLFRCYRKQQATVYSGKRSAKGTHMVDDMLMALITAVAWARLPQNSYAIE